MTRKILLALLATTGLVPATAFAQELPTGGEVQAGRASIQQTAPGAMQITQDTNRAIINWQSFSVGEGGRIDISQPDAQSALLNRVTGDTTSTIAGQINANGRVFLVNPNGIVITRTGSVNAGGFTASTIDIADKAFMNGSEELTVTAPRQARALRYARGGFAGLLGGKTQGGYVVAGIHDLDAGGGQALDLDGAGFLQVAMPSGGITVDGRINASEIVLKADTARAAARGVVNVAGVLDASSVTQHGGTITLTGDEVNLTGATLAASGATGGGSIRVGGDRQGSGALPHARALLIDARTTLTADATVAGDGGTIVAWSDERTDFAGAISARGTGGGKGGDAEVSGKALLAFEGTANLTGATFGTLLLDPYNVTISTGTQSTGSGFTATQNDSVINNITLQNALATANVTVSTGSGGTQNGDIFVDAPIAWSSGSLLTLSAAGQVYLNRNIDVNGGGQLALNFATTNALTGGLVYAVGAKVTFADGQTGQSLSLNGNAYTLLRSIAEIDAIDASATTLTARFALAKDLDASGTTYNTPIIGTMNGSQIFSGALEGLGHSINNLSINTGSGNYAALIGRLAGTVRGLSLLGGSFSGGTYVAPLAGIVSSGALISQVKSNAAVTGISTVGGLVGSISSSTTPGAMVALSYATGTVTSTGGSWAGGLAGTMLGTTASIVQSYATGNVSGSTSGTGGLVGATSNGIITQSYATGAVTGGTGSRVGGLVGNINGGTLMVSQSYATGRVSGGQAQGGLAAAPANMATATITNSYWDTQTTGQSSSVGGTGLTTAQLQNGTLPTGFDATVWTAVQGFYPQLRPVSMNGVAGPLQVVSGTAFVSPGGAAANGAAIALYYNGALLSGNSVTSDASGAYKALVPANTLSGTFAIGQTIALAGSGTISGQSYNDNLTTGSDGNVTGLTISAGVRAITSSAASLGAVDTALSSIFGSGYGGIDTALGNTATVLTATATTFESYNGASRRGDFTINTTAPTGQFYISSAIATTGRLFINATSSFRVVPGASLSSGAGLVAVNARSYALQGPLNIADGTTLSLAAPGNIAIGANITGTGGTLILAPGGGAANTGAVSATGAINVGTFNLLNGSWSQVGTLPAFAANDFRFKIGSATFLRATGGAGTSANPYTITDSYGLQGLASQSLQARSFTLAGNIDASGTANWNGGAGFVPIGTDGTGALYNGSGYVVTTYYNPQVATGFRGTFNGGGFTVSGLTINRPDLQNVGLFGGSSGTIGNLTLSGNMRGYVSVGGLVGLQQGGSITGVTSRVNVTGSSYSAYIGGLVGFASGTTIGSSSASGAISATGAAGGLVGLLYDSTLSNSSSSSTVTGRSGKSGGLVGIVERARVTGGSSTGSVNGGPAGATPYGVLRDGGTYETVQPL